MGAGAIWIIPIAMVFDINAQGGVQIPPCEYLSVNGGVVMTSLFPEHYLLSDGDL